MQRYEFSEGQRGLHRGSLCAKQQHSCIIDQQKERSPWAEPLYHATPRQLKYKFSRLWCAWLGPLKSCLQGGLSSQVVPLTSPCALFPLQEQELKAAADGVLAEVRKKQSDTKRMVDILRALEKLRKLRKEAAARKGKNSSYSPTGWSDWYYASASRVGQRPVASLRVC